MTDSPTALYTAWLDALPKLFQALQPAGSAGAPAPQGAEAGQSTAPFPADQVGQAMSLVDGILTQLYHSWLPLLAQGELSAEPLKAMAAAGTAVVDKLLATMTQPLDGWASGPANPLQLGIERSFGGVADAFGLRPMRELEQALRETLSASLAKQRAQAEYLGLVGQAFNDGTQGLLKDLNAMGARGERIESLLAFIRQWAKSVDGPMHDAMQSEAGLVITAKVIRAATQHRQQVQKAIGLASEALQVPTRAEMDEAYREIQELKREVRRMKKLLPGLVPALAVPAAAVAEVAAVSAVNAAPPAATAATAKKTATRRRAKEKQA